ncbi:MAG: acyl-CoA dehydrogenase family protein [Chloroflexota bacterium]|nr:acyl-CoA dehydrogenase family protein [Chloroflexota bacterium]
MDFGLSKEEEAFRQEIEQFMKGELPDGWIGAGIEEEFSEEIWPLTQVMAKKLAAKGWLTLSWPREYGGLELSLMKQAIYSELVGYYGFLGTRMGCGGVEYIGPVIMLYGSEEQKIEYLRQIASAESWWCCGYSEPNAGSYIASLQCRAVREGDGYVINGQKIWTTAAHIANLGFVAARTDPIAQRHRGISLFIVDMKSPGVTLRPLENSAGLKLFNEVFFDNVYVPEKNRLGEENKGWYCLMSAFNIERAAGPGLKPCAQCQRILDLLVSYVKEAQQNKYAIALDNSLVRHKLAETAVEIQAGRLFNYRVIYMMEKGMIAEQEASMSKLYSSELMQRVANTGMQILELYGQLEKESPWVPLQGYLLSTYLMSIGFTIGGGTSEIQRNVIATRGLGLPR